MAASLFHEHKVISINQMHIDINQTKKQTEKIPSSQVTCFIFHFIWQSTSVPNLESRLCKLVKELDDCNFTFE